MDLLNAKFRLLCFILGIRKVDLKGMKGLKRKKISNKKGEGQREMEVV